MTAIYISLDSLEKRSDCPYCRNRFPSVIGQVYIPSFFHSPVGKIELDKALFGNLELLKCPNCGLLYKNMVPTKKTMVEIYNTFGQNGNEAKWCYEPDNEYLIRRIQIVKRMSKGQQHILDVGCDTGLFLRLAQQAGFETSGLDPSNVAHAELRNYVNMGFYSGFLEDAQIPANTFDFITAWDVLEHFHDVSTALQKIHRGLKPGGYLLLETGNVSSLPAKLRSPNNWWYVSLLEHFNFFDESSVRYILNDMGFRTTKIMRTYHKSIDTLGNARMSLILCKSLIFYISPSVYRCLTKLIKRSGGAARLPWKDHILVVARKPQ